MAAPDSHVLNVIEGGDVSSAAWRALRDALEDGEIMDDERAIALIRQHVRAIPEPELACALARVAAARSPDGATATYALTAFLRRGDAPAESIDGALWSLVWLTARDQCDTGAVEDVLGSNVDADRAARFAALLRALDIAMGASSIGERIQAEARDRLRAIGAASLLADAERHLTISQRGDVAAALRRAGIP